MKAALKLVLGGLAGAIVLVLGTGDDAKAQCCAPPVPPCCIPPAPPPPPQNTCCTPPGHSVNVPGVNVFVGASVVVNATANGAASAGAGAGAAGRAGSVVFVGGGGGYGGGLMPPPVGMIQGLNVEGGREMRRTAYEASRTKTVRVVIQAFCLDDRSVPHPASQVFPDRDVDSAYEGELFRCIAGSRMQYVYADYFDKISFDGGKTVTCEKGQALYRNRDGALECRRQKPARDCNERSLLRRFGAGVKVLTIITVEKYTAYREEMVESSSSSMGSMSLSGGVGGIAY